MSIAANYENIWKILSEYHIEFEYELNENFKCTICKEILKNGCYNTCGCKYCLNCIRAYLNEEEKYCPNLSEYCKEEMINPERDIQIDHITNMKISKVRAKCPIQFCTHLDELKNMNDHLKTHKEDSSNFRIDRVNEDLNESIMLGYLQENHNFDSGTRMNSVRYLESALAFLKKDIERIEIQSIETQEKHLEMENLNDSTKSEITSLKETIELKQKKYESTKSSLKQEYPSTPEQNFEVANNGKMKTGPNLPLASSGIKIQGIPEKIRKKYAPFTWKVGEVSKKRIEAKAGRNTMIKSDPFYAYPEGYKLCIVLYPNGVGSGTNTHLSLGFQILKGEYDNLLNWPMKVGMVLSLNDNVLGAFLFSKFFELEIGADKTRYMRPATEMNAPIGKPKYIKFKDLCNGTLYHEMYSNDSICIVATIKSLHSHYEEDTLWTSEDLANDCFL